jgi:type I restriction enzyme S subunit
LQTLSKEHIVTGSAQPQVTINDLKRVKIRNPPLPEQRKIAHILSTADAVIEKTQAAIAKYKAIKQGMLHDLFTRGIDPATNKLRPTYEDAPELYKKNKLGWIPKEWEVKQVKEVNDVFGGKRLPAGHNYSESNYGFKYLRVTDFYKKSILYSGLENLFPETFDILQRYEIQNDELFISIAGSIGFVGVLRHDLLDKVILTENALRIHPTQNIHPDFLAMQMNADVVQIQIWSEIGTGGGVPKLALHRVENLKILIPKNMEQLKIAERLLSIDNKIQTEQAYLHKMQQIKAGLMADLLSGKKKVNVNE